MLDEVLEHLALCPGGYCVDATINGGGHAAAMLDAIAPDGCLLGIDRDPDLLSTVSARLADHVEAGRLRFAVGNFNTLTTLIGDNDFPPAQGILLDLGLSSYHLDNSGRGFSYAHDEPLDMRFDPHDTGRETAAEIVNTCSAAELTTMLRDYGEERFASRIARTIVTHRTDPPIATTSQLLRLIEMALPAKVRWRAGRHAARVFQALRIATNEELQAVGEVLPQAVAALAPGGRIAVISFHSLEDRMVKHFFREEHENGRLKVVTRRPLRASPEEIETNPRAASAKLRVAERSA
jgi:16S rRNA (cytosine1402-N4)-methyltransferase